MDKRGKRLVLLILSALVVLMTGCEKRGIKLYTPEQAIVFTQTESEEYDCMQVEANGKKYLPYCAADPSMCEEVIGYYDVEETEISEGGRIYVLSCKDLSCDEWIIDCFGDEGEYVSGHNVGMLLREESVTDIPENLQGESEYERNQSIGDRETNSDAPQAEGNSPKEEAISIYEEAKFAYDKAGEQAESGITSDMVEATGNQYDIADKCLNDIWVILKDNVSSDEYEKIFDEQRAWLTTKEETAQKDADEFGGGSFATVQYNSTLASMTMTRCAELIEYING